MSIKSDSTVLHQLYNKFGVYEILIDIKKIEMNYEIYDAWLSFG